LKFAESIESIHKKMASSRVTTSFSSSKQLHAAFLVVGISFTISFLVTIMLAYAPEKVGSGVMASSFVLYFLASLRIFLCPIPESLESMYSADELAIETFVMANHLDPRMSCQPCNSNNNSNESSSSHNQDTTKSSPQHGHQESHCCCICLEKMKPGEAITKSQLCRHSFHQGCLQSWLSIQNSQSSCPYCRRDLHRYAPAIKPELSSDNEKPEMSIIENVWREAMIS
jgi:hypothetical protein